jgi:hypothetical protein
VTAVTQFVFSSGRVLAAPPPSPFGRKQRCRAALRRGGPFPFSATLEAAFIANAQR